MTNQGHAVVLFLTLSKCVLFEDQHQAHALRAPGAQRYVWLWMDLARTNLFQELLCLEVVVLYWPMVPSKMTKHCYLLAQVCQLQLPVHLKDQVHLLNCLQADVVYYSRSLGVLVLWEHALGE